VSKEEEEKLLIKVKLDSEAKKKIEVPQTSENDSKDIKVFEKPASKLSSDNEKNISGKSSGE
jgi:hypothetical protein